MSIWRKRANQAIGQAITAGKLADESAAEIRARVDAAYPFGQRMYHPYKIWLKVRREHFAAHCLLTDAEKARELTRPMRDPEKRQNESAGQTAIEWEKAKEAGLIK